MNQQKIGMFLKDLRKQKGLTQEQFAEIVHVSNRTVSRWENGNNMPDLDVLIEIADYYEIELRELLDGERKSEKMNKELEETVLKAVDYTTTETQRHTKMLHWFLRLGAILWLVSNIIRHVGPQDVYVINAISDFAEGMACGMLIIGVILTGRFGYRIHAFKQRLLKRE